MFLAYGLANGLSLMAHLLVVVIEAVRSSGHTNMRMLPRNNVWLEGGKKRALQDLISVKFSSFKFCHNIEVEMAFIMIFCHDATTRFVLMNDSQEP